MRIPQNILFPLIPSVLGLIAFIAILIIELRAYTDGIISMASHDIQTQTEITKKTLLPSLNSGDFRQITILGEYYESNNSHLRIQNKKGGILYDSRGNIVDKEPFIDTPKEITKVPGIRFDGQNYYIHSSVDAGDYIIRLAIPFKDVKKLLSRTRIAHIASALTALLAFAIVLLFVLRAREKVKLLIKEKEQSALELQNIQRQEAYRRDFIGNFAHELRTPLTGLNAAVELLLKSENLTHDEKSQLEQMIKRETGNLTELTTKILTLSELENCETSHNFILSDLTEIVQTIHENFTPLARQKGIDFTLAVPSPVTAKVDRKLIKEALSNLVVNAIHHSQCTTLSLSLCQQENKAVITVADNGQGIPRPDQSRIFERFYRVNKERSRANGGSGLGLAIVKHIIRLHHGEITLRSPPGATFQIIMPLK